MQSSIKSLIIDDESLARKRVKNLLTEVPEIEVLGECDSGKKAIEQIKTLQPQLLFLDIQMSDMTGFDVLNSLEPENRPLIIFITAFDEFALQAFDFFAIDYLLKPFKDDRFFKSTQRVIEIFNNNESSTLTNRLNQLLLYAENPNLEVSNFKSEKLPIKTNGKVQFIDKVDIKYIQASGYYAEVFTDQKKYLLRDSLNSLIEQLNSSSFFRIHRSTIINTEFIKELIYSNFGEIDVKMKDEKLFRISKTHKKEFQKKMGI